MTMIVLVMVMMMMNNIRDDDYDDTGNMCDGNNGDDATSDSDYDH